MKYDRRSAQIIVNANFYKLKKFLLDNQAVDTNFDPEIDQGSTNQFTAPTTSNAFINTQIGTTQESQESQESTNFTSHQPSNIPVQPKTSILEQHQESSSSESDPSDKSGSSSHEHDDDIFTSKKRKRIEVSSPDGYIHFLYMITNIFGVAIKTGRSYFNPNKSLDNFIEDDQDLEKKAISAVRRRYHTPYGTNITVKVYIVEDNSCSRERCFHNYVRK